MSLHHFQATAEYNTWHRRNMTRTARTNLHILVVCLAAGLALYLCYLLTYTGIRLTTDERKLIDAAESIIVSRHLWFNQTFDLVGPSLINLEPAQPLLAAPLYWLAYHTPQIGNVQAILLFTPLVTAATAGVLFLFAYARGYQLHTALLTAMLFGLTTIAWPYAQTFFREPLAGFALLTAAFFIEQWRTRFVLSKRSHRWWIVPSLLAVVLLVTTKDAMLLTLPALLALAYPGRRLLRQYHSKISLAVVLVAIGTVLYLSREYGGIFVAYTPRSIVDAFLGGLSHAWIGTGGYLISPGKAIWWFSPVLLLALTAPFLLPRTRWRETWLPLMLLLWFAISYAAIKQELWFGGAGWGARYMLPVVPFMMLGTLPFIERALSSRSSMLKLVVGLLGGIGGAIQLVAVYTDIFSYYDHLVATTGQLVWLGPATWTVRWSQPVGSLLFLPDAKTNIRWLTPTTDWLTAVVLGAGIGLALMAVIWLARSSHITRARAVTVSGALIATGLAFSTFTLIRSYDDPRYLKGIEGLEQLDHYLLEHTQPNDTILLSNPRYEPYFANYYKGNAVWFTLPWSPGERYSWEEEPKVESDRVTDLLHPMAANLIQRLTSPNNELYSGGLIWLVTDNGPYHPWATRPPERYLSERAYTVGATEFQPTVRLLSYLPLTAPGIVTPATITHARFGEAIRLAGFDLVRQVGATCSGAVDVGNNVGVSLLWIADQPVTADYIISVQLIDGQGAVVLQQDRQPVGGFLPTNEWKPKAFIRDNYGFVLPLTLTPEEYTLQVVVYSWPSLERLPVLASVSSAGEDTYRLSTVSVEGIRVGKCSSPSE